MNIKKELEFFKIDDMDSVRKDQFLSPYRDNAYGFVYVIMFENGLFKIGKSRDLISRTNFIRSLFRDVIGKAVLYATRRHFNYSKTEAALLNRFSNLSHEFGSHGTIEDMSLLLKYLDVSDESESEFKERIDDKNKRMGRLIDFLSPSNELLESISYIATLEDKWFDILEGFEKDSDVDVYFITKNIGILVDDDFFYVLESSKFGDEISTKHEKLSSAFMFIYNNLLDKYNKSDKMAA